jgi:hypothetical protein
LIFLVAAGVFSASPGMVMSFVDLSQSAMAAQPTDRNGRPVGVGTRVRLVGLSGQWLEDLPPDEKQDVLSMIGEVFEVEEIDEHGHPWIRKSWPNEAKDACHSHSIALEPQEMEVVGAAPP